MRLILLGVILVVGMSIAQDGSMGDCTVTGTGTKQYGETIVVEGVVRNVGQFPARAVTVEARGVDAPGDHPGILWQHTLVVKDVSAGGSRTFKFSKVAPPEKTVQMRIVRVER